MTLEKYNNELEDDDEITMVLLLHTHNHTFVYLERVQNKVFMQNRGVGQKDSI